MLRLIRLVKLLRNQRGLTAAKAMAFVTGLPGFLRLVVRLLKDGRVPSRLKIYCLLAVAYFVSPLDFIPDLLGPLFGIGFADDLTFLTLAFTKLVKDSPQHVVDEHLEALGHRTRPS